MRKSILAVTLAVTALAVVVNVGFKLAGALRQVGELAGANVGSVLGVSDPQGLNAVARVEVFSVAPPAPKAAGEQVVLATHPSAPESEPPLWFDTEAALREAGDHDPNVAELLSDPDPAVSSAVRAFITSASSIDP